MVGIFDSAFFLGGFQHFLQASGLRRRPCRKFQQPPGAVGFRLIKFRQIVHNNSCQFIPDQALPFHQPGKAFLHRGFVNTQQLGRGSNQLIFRQEAMARRKIVAKLKQNARFHPAAVIAGNAQVDGKPVHCPKGGIQALIHQ